MRPSVDEGYAYTVLSKEKVPTRKTSVEKSLDAQARLQRLVRNWLDRESKGEDATDILQEMKVAARELLAG